MTSEFTQSLKRFYEDKSLGQLIVECEDKARCKQLQHCTNMWTNRHHILDVSTMIKDNKLCILKPVDEELQ